MWTRRQGCTEPRAEERRGVCSGIYRMFEPTCNTTPRTEKGGRVFPAPHVCPLTVAVTTAQHRRHVCLQSSPAEKTMLSKRRHERNSLPKSVSGRSWNVMPAWTTGGTDVICEEEMDDTGETDEGWGGGRREGEEERRNEARLQGWTQNVSLPPFFQYSLLMKFHLDCKCSVIYHHKCVMGPWIQWHCAG